MHSPAMHTHAAAVLAPHWIELARTEHWIVEREPTLRVVALRRTTTPIVDVALAQDTSGALERALSLYDASTHAILVDMRAAPMRSDPDFEQRMRATQTRVLGRFARNAALVATAVGKLQVTRARREGGLDDHGVFMDEREALAYLARPRGK